MPFLNINRFWLIKGLVLFYCCVPKVFDHFYHFYWARAVQYLNTALVTHMWGDVVQSCRTLLILFYFVVFFYKYKCQDMIISRS